MRLRDRAGGGAKGNLTLTSDRSKDPLNVIYDVRRADATSAVIIQQLEAKIGSLSVSATGSVNTQTTPSPLQIHAKTASAPIADLMRLAALYGAKLPADLEIDGNLQADVQITGTSDKPLLAENRGDKAQITAKELAEPVQASTCSHARIGDRAAVHHRDRQHQAGGAGDLRLQRRQARRTQPSRPAARVEVLRMASACR